MELIDQAVEYLRAGFGDVNNPRGLLIALAATVFLGSWRQWPVLALLSTLVHLAIDVLAPVLSGGGGEIRLPDITGEGFWTQAGVLFLGYMIVIGLFFVVKKLIFRGGGGH